MENAAESPVRHSIADIYADDLAKLRARMADEARAGRLPHRAPGRATIAGVSEEIVAHLKRALRIGVSLTYLVRMLAQSVDLPRRWAGHACSREEHDVQIDVLRFLSGRIDRHDLERSCRERASASGVTRFALALPSRHRTKRGVVELGALAAQIIVKESRSVGLSPSLALEYLLEIVRDTMVTAQRFARSSEPDVEAILGPYLEVDAQKIRSSAALQRARDAGMRLAPLAGIGGAKWQGRLLAADVKKDRSGLILAAHTPRMDVLCFDPDADEEKLARDVGRAVAGYRRWRAMVEEPANESHPVLARALKLGMKIVRDPAVKQGNGAERDGSTLRVAPKLGAGMTWAIVRRHVNEYAAELRAKSPVVLQAAPIECIDAAKSAGIAGRAAIDAVAASIDAVARAGGGARAASAARQHLATARRAKVAARQYDECCDALVELERAFEHETDIAEARLMRDWDGVIAASAVAAERTNQIVVAVLREHFGSVLPGIVEVQVEPAHDANAAA